MLALDQLLPHYVWDFEAQQGTAMRELRLAWGAGPPCQQVSQLDLHPFTRLALSLVRMNDQSTPTRVHVYTDGSFDPDSGTAAWAFSVVHEFADGFGFQGCHAGRLPDQDVLNLLGMQRASNVAAEHLAVAMAVLWSVQARPGCSVHIHSDSLTTCKQTLALWQVNAHARFVQRMRHLWCAASSVCELSLRHVKAHSGHPWNELSDIVAKSVLAASGWSGVRELGHQGTLEAFSRLATHAPMLFLQDAPWRVKCQYPPTVQGRMTVSPPLKFSMLPS